MYVISLLYLFIKLLYVVCKIHNFNFTGCTLARTRHATPQKKKKKITRHAICTLRVKSKDNQRNDWPCRWSCRSQCLPLYKLESPLEVSNSAHVLSNSSLRPAQVYSNSSSLAPLPQQLAATASRESSVASAALRHEHDDNQQNQSTLC